MLQRCRLAHCLAGSEAGGKALGLETRAVQADLLGNLGSKTSVTVRHLISSIIILLLFPL